MAKRHRSEENKALVAYNGVGKNIDEKATSNVYIGYKLIGTSTPPTFEFITVSGNLNIVILGLLTYNKQSKEEELRLRNLLIGRSSSSSSKYNEADDIALANNTIIANDATIAVRFTPNAQSLVCGSTMHFGSMEEATRVATNKSSATSSGTSCLQKLRWSKPYNVWLLDNSDGGRGGSGATTVEATAAVPPSSSLAPLPALETPLVERIDIPATLLMRKLTDQYNWVFRINGNELHSRPPLISTNPARECFTFSWSGSDRGHSEANGRARVSSIYDAILNDKNLAGASTETEQKSYEDSARLYRECEPWFVGAKRVTKPAAIATNLTHTNGEYNANPDVQKLQQRLANGVRYPLPLPSVPQSAAASSSSSSSLSSLSSSSSSSFLPTSFPSFATSFGGSAAAPPPLASSTTLTQLTSIATMPVAQPPAPPIRPILARSENDDTGGTKPEGISDAGNNLWERASDERGSFVQSLIEAERGLLTWKKTRYAKLIEDVTRVAQSQLPRLEQYSKLGLPNETIKSDVDSYGDSIKRVLALREILQRVTSRLDELQTAQATPATRQVLRLQKRTNIRNLIREVETLGGSQRAAIRQTLYSRVVAFAGSPAPFVDSFTNNYVLTGGPGVGKTVTARVIAKVMYLAGLLLTDVVYSRDRSTLIGQYLGQTAPRVRSAVDNALEGVLFIDEAYAVTGCPDARTGQWGDYGKEAADTLVPLLSDYAGLIAVVVAGYENDMRRCFLKSNDGFPRRFRTRLALGNYTANDLYGILNTQVAERMRGTLLDESTDGKIERANALGLLLDPTTVSEIKADIKSWVDIPTNNRLVRYQAGDMQNLADFILEGYYYTYGTRRIAAPWPSRPPQRLDRQSSAVVWQTARENYIQMKNADSNEQ